MNINNTSPTYPKGTHYGMAYHGVLTLFGILRDIDPTKIYGKYASHPIKKGSRDLIFKLFEEAGFECYPVLIDYENSSLVETPLLNYDKRNKQVNLPISKDVENNNKTQDKNGIILDEEIEQIAKEKRTSSCVIDNIACNESFEKNEAFPNIDFSNESAPGAIDNIYYQKHLTNNDSLKVCIFLHKTKLMCFYVSFDDYLQGYLDFTPSNIQFTQKLYKSTVYIPEKQPDTYKTRIIIQSKAGLSIQEIVKDVVPSIKNISEYNYNDDFNMNKLYNFIESDEPGLAILHGEPGTGKTTFIKHLLMKYTKSNKKIVYLPLNLASNIDDPVILNFFLEHPNTIYVIEDAEQLIKSRDSGNNKLAGFLNATDGILSSILSIKFILTFNTKITTEHVDQALLRKGRLRYIYEFKKLNKDRASKLTGKKILKDTSLADLYNEEDTNYVKNVKTIGFN